MSGLRTGLQHDEKLKGRLFAETDDLIDSFHVSPGFLRSSATLAMRVPSSLCDISEIAHDCDGSQVSINEIVLLIGCVGG